MVGVTLRCEKLGCNDVAEVAFGIDRQSCVVWLEHYDVDNARHLNRLCDEHAARLTLPRGWSFDDRRESSPRLFVARTPAQRVVQLRDATKAVPRDATKAVPRDATKSTPRDATRSTKRPAAKKPSTPRRTSRETTPPLKRLSGPGLFDPTMPMPAPHRDNAPHRDTAPHHSAPQRTTAHGETRPEPDTQPVANTQTVPDIQTVPDGQPLTESLLAPEDDPSSPLYVPKFDRSSDVGGVLNATGRLLGRAFSSQTRPIERPSVNDTDGLAAQGDHIDDVHQGEHVE